MDDHSYSSTPNASISLEEVQIELVIGSETIQASARPSIRLLPTPRLEFEFSCDAVGLILGDVGPQITLLQYGLKLDSYASQVSSTGEGVTGTLVPRRQPCAIRIKPRRRLHTLEFGILNFPRFFGKQDRSVAMGSQGRRRVGMVSLRAGPWRIDISEIHNLGEVEQQLDRDGGYAITHAGATTRLDGKTFSVNDAHALLDALRLFLSFARGGGCCPILPKGFCRHGDLVWEQWGVGLVLPSCYTPSWFDTMHGHILSEVFPGFWNCLNDPQWGDAVRTSLYWYLRSNAHGQGAGIDGGLILSQAALERLAYGHFGKDKRSASQRLTEMLKAKRIGTAIPKCCKKLHAAAVDNRWKDGSAAVTGVRNQLVHPTRRGGLVSGAYYEAWNLAQNYVELVLLSLCRYAGEYGDRITQKWRGEVVKVPWA